MFRGLEDLGAHIGFEGFGAFTVLGGIRFLRGVGFGA